MGTPAGGGEGGKSGGGAGPTSLLAIGLKGFGDYTEGQGNKAASDYKAARLEQAARYGRVAAEQTDGQLTEQLNTTLGNIDAIRAAADIDPTSPTTAAIRERQSFVADRQRTTSVNNMLRQAAQSEADANYMRRAGEFALKQSYLKAGIRVVDGINSLGPGGGGRG